ncbi:2-polyprenyl-6-methoxyphenol hydroxylase [Microbacterium sp. cf046]|uniref:FAD-dependent oxidoreductase n=1 Tax=Microbacterium sp. cf046 TaxID=1761803 RepID=UPI0008EF474E|nr:NAD(P)/FAD-dependent oxidoreductase [Microbacterium sp. cf046]SFS13815.1 2-polyprenyl-6-methoxyphenol hydroxylase [Microbacterium sp. cf046]
MPRALVIGGGVAGPAAAMFLQRAGWDVEVFEADQEPDPFEGLFLNVATNGLAVLDQLGLRDRLGSDGHRAPKMVMRSGTGRELGAVPNGPAGDPGRGSVIVRRGWLHQVIREGAIAAGVPFTFGARLVSIEETPTLVRATFADGRIAEGDILIGADGIGSPTRRWIDPSAPEPRYSGLVGTGGYARVHGLEPTPDTQYFVFGARSFFGYLVRADGTVYWFANMTTPEPARGSLREVPSAQWLARLRDLHSDDPFPVPQILANVTGEVGAYPIFDLVGVTSWSRGRVVAIGDAVHATSPSAGQGASLALEDAITLAKCLRDVPDRADAFAEYQRERRPRAEAVVKYARVIDSQKRVTKSRIGIAIRDWMMPKFLKNAADDTRNDWLYNHRIAWESPVPSPRP